MSETDYIQMLRVKYQKIFLTKKEIALELSTSQATIDRLRKNGTITAKMVLGQVMFPLDEIARFITEN